MYVPFLTVKIAYGQLGRWCRSVVYVPFLTEKIAYGQLGRGGGVNHKVVSMKLKIGQ